MGKKRQVVTLLEQLGIVRRQHAEEDLVDHKNYVFSDPGFFEQSGTTNYNAKDHQLKFIVDFS